MEVTLEELLLSRDNRHLKHLQLLRQYPQFTLVSVTVVMPGPDKSNSLSLALADIAEKFLQQCSKLHIQHLERYDRKTGSEIYFLCDLPLFDTKRLCCMIEDRHPLGRLWDFDVIDSSSRPVSRTEIGLKSRKCIICGDDAITCIRARKHSKQELAKKVEEIFTLNREAAQQYEF